MSIVNFLAWILIFSGPLSGSSVTASVSIRPSWQVCNLGPLGIGTQNSWGHYISVIGRRPFLSRLVCSVGIDHLTVSLRTSWQLGHVGPLSIGTSSVNRSIHNSGQQIHTSYSLHTLHNLCPDMIIYFILSKLFILFKLWTESHMSCLWFPLEQASKSSI